MVKKKAVTTKIATSPISSTLIGRLSEIEKLRAAVNSSRNVLLEGPVGVGKTHLALSVIGQLKRPVFRVDGDGRYSEQKLSGWFDPPSVLKHGFSAKTFVAGPLVEAMRTGGVLFINELNRLPEGVQNVLLPAIDERLIVVPRLGEIRAKDGFLVIATQNPKEFVATSHLSEAILDRFELVVVDYQSESEEREIVRPRIPAAISSQQADRLVAASVRLARLTRAHSRVRRGASVRAAQAIAELASALMQDGAKFEYAFRVAVQMALPTRIEIERGSEGEMSMQQEIQALLEDWIQQALQDLPEDAVASGAKKKS